MDRLKGKTMNTWQIVIDVCINIKPVNYKSMTMVEAIMTIQSIDQYTCILDTISCITIVNYYVSILL